MSTKTVEAIQTPNKPLFFIPQTKIGKITAIEIDNPTTESVTITIKDIFTPIPSLENPTPSEVIENKKVITVQPNQHFSETNININVIGSLFVFANVDNSNIITTITYEIE